MIEELLSKARKRIERDRDISWPTRIKQLGVAAFELSMGLTCLRGFTSLGWGARVCGKPPRVVNLGEVRVGNLFVVRSHTAEVLIETSREGRIDIGDSVFINFGSLIGARSRIQIGNRVLVGPYSVICDTEFTDPSQDQPARPIRIDDDVWLAARVTVLPGSHIGKGSVITSGSIVDGEIPAGVVAGGCPASVRRTLDADKSNGGRQP